MRDHIQKVLRSHSYRRDRKQPSFESSEMYRDLDYKMSTLVLKGKNFEKIKEFFRLNPKALINTDTNGRNVLHWAVNHRDINLVKLLYALGSPMSKDKLGLTPLGIARKIKATNIVNLLS